MEEELIDIVDENDNVVGHDTRENKLYKGLISRNVVVFIFDKDNKLLIARRSPHKRTFPNK